MVDGKMPVRSESSGLFMNVHTDRAKGRERSPVCSSVSPMNSRWPTFTG